MKKQEESADEKALTRIIAAKLREQLHETPSGCPDAEMLAAFYDRVLADGERVVCENHLLTCLRCQGYLAELARLGDADEPPALVEVETPTFEEAKPSWTFRLAWVAPLLIVAIGSAVWFREDIQRLLQRPQETAMTTTEPAPEPESPASARERGVAAKKEAPETPAETSLAKTAPPAAPLPGGVSGGLRTNEPAISVAGPGREAEGARGAMAPPSQRAELSAAAKPAQRVLAFSAEQKEKRAEVADRAVAPSAAAPAVTAPTAEVAPTLARKDTSELGGVTIQGAAPQLTPQWRVGRHGSIQKADRAGGWVNVPSGVSSDLFDISFAGSSVGWAVGHEGTVLRSTDGGNTWRQASAPTSEDLVHVSAQSAQRAQVISRSGALFSTTDGGRTWKAAAE